MKRGIAFWSPTLNFISLIIPINVIFRISVILRSFLALNEMVFAKRKQTKKIELRTANLDTRLHWFQRMNKDSVERLYSYSRGKVYNNKIVYIIVIVIIILIIITIIVIMQLLRRLTRIG